MHTHAPQTSTALDYACVGARITNKRTWQSAHRPYVRLLHEESKDIAGLLSQLPAEVAIEDIAKAIVIVRAGPPAAACTKPARQCLCWAACGDWTNRVHNSMMG